MGFWKNPRVNAGTLALRLRDSRREIKFFQRAGIIANSAKCSACGATCTTIIYSTKQFKCSKCRRGMSVFNNTFMSGLRCSIRRVVMMSKIINFDYATIYLWFILSNLQCIGLLCTRAWHKLGVTLKLVIEYLNFPFMFSV